MAALRVRWNMARRKREEGKEQQEEAEAEDEDEEEEVNESKLEETFSKLGPLEALVLSPERSNRYAIVYYNNLKDAKDAKYLLHGARLLGTSAVLHLEIIGQEDVKLVFKHAVCDTTQSCDTFSQPSHILKGIFRSLRNKLISPSEAFEDLNQLAIKLEDKIKNQPDKWAPAVYERLLSKDKMESTLADCFLKFLKSKLVPPTPVLSEIVSQNIQHNLLKKMEELVQVQSYKVAAVNAWSWLIQLLGTHGVENKNLINRMLKIVEKTFIDKDIEVRIASQVAWKAIIDIIVPSPFEITKEKTSDTGEDINWPPAITSKHMKLLMTPLIGIMTLDNAARSLNSCWKICIYVLQKLDSLLNNTSVMQFILFPMFESSFNPGRNSWNMSVWDSSACLFEEFLSCKLKINPNVKMINEGVVIKWPIWSSVHIGCLLKIFESLWNSCIRAFPDSDNRLLLKYVFRIWHLILKGLALDRVISVEGMEEHQKAVHETLKLVSSICEDVPSLCIEGYKKKLILTVWSLLEFMVIEFGHEILASSLYEVSLEKNNLGTCILSNTYSLALKTSCASNRETKQINAKVTPIYYISVIWMKCIKALGFHHENSVEDFCKMIDKDSLLSLWMAFIGHHRGEQPLDVSDFKDYCQYERVNEFPFPLLLFPCLMSSILKIKKRAEALECLVHSKVLSTYSDEKWSLSADLNNAFSMGYNLNCLNGGIGHPSSLSASMSSGSDLMGAILFNFIKLCERLVTDVVLKSCKSLQKQNFVYSLSMVAGFLMLISDRKVSCFYTNSSVLGALCDLSNLLSNERENSVFLQIISEPLACWLACCSDYKYNSYANILEGRQHLLSFPKHLEFFLRTFGSLINSVDASTLQGVVEFKCNKSSSALAVVSRYLTISWNSVTYNSERDKQLISRVCDALMCLCSSLESQDEILAIMQALSSPLIKWFSNSLIDKLSMDGDHYVGLVEKIWFAMLTSFEKCQSAASFDFETLEKIAELLASALKCAHGPIAEKTVLFWGKTFGAKNIDISVLQDSQSDLTIMSLPKKETIHLSNESFSEKEDIQKGNLKQYEKHETIVGADQGQVDDQKTSRIIGEDLSEKKHNGKYSVEVCAQNEEEQPCKNDAVNTQKTIVNKRRGKNKGFMALGVRKEIRKCGSISGLSRECSITIANEEAASERDSLGEHVISKSNVKRRRDRRRKVPMFLKALKSDIKILGIRHVRLLRNIAGRLRGGKHWRNRNRMLGMRNAIRKKKKRSQRKRQINIPDKDIDRFADAEAMDSNDFMGAHSENPKLDSWQMSDIPFRVRTLVDGIRSDDGDGDANLLSKRAKDSRQDVVASGCTSTVEFDLPSLEKKLGIPYRRNPRKKKSPKRLPSHLLLDEILTDEELLTSVEGIGTEEDGDYIPRPVKRLNAHSTSAFSLSTQLGNKNQIDHRASPGTNVHCKYGESQMIYNLKQAHHIPDGTLAFGSSGQLTNADRGDNDGCNTRLNLNSEACKSNTSSGGSERCFTVDPAASQKSAKDIIKRARMCDVLHELSTSDAIEEMGVEEVCVTIQRLNVLSEKLMKRHKTLPTVPR